jgi:glycosyltransferase involved in cell wall biosynthesis
MIKVSVIICTHNPREDYLRRVLEAIECQTLPKEKWEFLLVDNDSSKPLASGWDLSWHPNARHISEKELGLTPTRIRGIREAQGEILVFVDDDNVLAPDYLAAARELVSSHPWIGALGGSTVGEFEEPPESWWEGRLENLAILDVKKEAWACLAGMAGLDLFTPCGAGMVIRRDIAADWAETVSKDPLKLGLGRKGNSLTGYDDTDMVLFVCSRGLAIGRFPQLSLTHLIPAKRLQRDYFIKLTEGNATSCAVLEFTREGIIPDLSAETQQPCFSERLLLGYKKLRATLRNETLVDPFEEELQKARFRGKQKAFQIIEEYRKTITDNHY